MEFSGHASQRSIYDTTIVFTVLACLVVALRLYTRLFIVRRSGWDDAFICIACILSVAMGVSICKQANYGMGIHQATLDSSNVRNAFAWFWNFIWLYYASLACTKLSILLQYLRIFPHTHFTRACYVLLCIVVVWGIWAVFSGMFTCVPVAKFWTESSWDIEGCMPRLALWYSNAAINIATDLATTLLPLPLIRQLAIPRRQRMILMWVFALGGFTCLMSVLRLAYIYPLAVSPDTTWNSPLPAIWSCVEANTAILCSCAPTLKGLIQKFFPTVLDSIRSHQTPISGQSESTQDSLKKSAADSRISVRPLPSLRATASERMKGGHKRAKSGTSPFADCFRRRGSEAASEEGIVELASLSDHSHGSNDSSGTRNDIEVETRVDQVTRERRGSDPPVPERLPLSMARSLEERAQMGTPAPELLAAINQRPFPDLSGGDANPSSVDMRNRRGAHLAKL
ncbi:hypothetical protein KC315_g14736, partial [Hortaea werneckii]